ncbi:MAG: hydrogenase formation protein HypD [Spirochaetes bacterium]|nr:hydrogenase formation protein HypD [Spirochaetota bacterium]
MKYIDEYRDGAVIKSLADTIRRESKTPETVMEVCGGHTNSIFKFGIDALMPETVSLVSGPGCPVCVTPIHYIDTAIEYAKRSDVITVTFGDLIRLPGSGGSLERARMNGADVRVVYSPSEALSIAADNPAKTVLFLGIGFETTAPLTAALIDEAAAKGMTNLVILPSHRIMPPAMQALVTADDIAVGAFICPGHVSVVTGSGIYEFLARDHHVPCVISGFEPADILRSILMIVRQRETGDARVEIEYDRAVNAAGSRASQDMLAKIFTLVDGEWRGLGVIPKSAYAIRPEYRQFDAVARLGAVDIPARENPACICADVLRAVKKPVDCPLYKKTCSPDNPQGACMVSPEGSCNIYFRHGRG